MILQYTKALLEEIGKISDQIFPIVNFYNSVEHFNSLDIDIKKQTKYYNMLINNHFKHIDRCLERAKKINYIDFNNAIKDFLRDLNLKDNIHFKIYNEAEELFHSGKYEKSFHWIHNEMKLLQDILLSQKTQLEKFQKNSQNEVVSLYFKIIEDGEIYSETKYIDLQDLNNPLVLYETINNLKFLIARINHTRLDVYEAFMPELNNKNTTIQSHPFPTVKFHKKSNQSAENGTTERLYLYFKIVNPKFLKKENSEELSKIFGINSQAYSRTIKKIEQSRESHSDYFYKKANLEKFLPKVRDWIELMEDKKFIQTFYSEYPFMRLDS